MVIGNGMLATQFKKQYECNSDVIIFASGVSNSNEVDESKYSKEFDLLTNTAKQYTSQKLVYFSSVIHLSGMQTRYLNHKREMESWIQNNVNRYVVLRLPQILGHGGNEQNLVNFFVKCIKTNSPIFAQKNTVRAIIDIDDLFTIANECISDVHNRCVDVSYIEKATAVQLAHYLYQLYGLPTNIVETQQGFSINSNNSDVVENIIDKHNLRTPSYTQRVLKKYIATI